MSNMVAEHIGATKARARKKPGDKGANPAKKFKF
jgi:hypothetical protein